MAKYSSYEGHFVYLDRESYIEIRNKLIANGWLSEEGLFLNEDDEPVNEDSELIDAPPPEANSILFIKNKEDKAKYILSVPYHNYRNFHRVLPELIKKANYYWYLWSTTDGDYSGGYASHATPETCTDMVDWAKENNVEVDEDDENYIQNLSEIEDEFREKHNWVPCFSVLSETTFYPKSKNIGGDTVIGEYKNDYLVSISEGISFTPKKKRSSNAKISTTKTRKRKVHSRKQSNTHANLSR